MIKFSLTNIIVAKSQRGVTGSGVFQQVLIFLGSSWLSSAESWPRSAPQWHACCRCCSLSPCCVASAAPGVACCERSAACALCSSASRDALSCSAGCAPALPSAAVCRSVAGAAGSSAACTSQASEGPMNEIKCFIEF